MNAERISSLPASLADLHPDTTSERFWQEARRGVLVCQRCTDCGTYRMPPNPYCWSCRSRASGWEHLSGRGTVFSYTVVRHAVLPEVAAAVPYAVAVVELPDAGGERLILQVVGCDHDDVRVGLEVEVVWDEVSPDVVVPRARPRAAGIAASP